MIYRVKQFYWGITSRIQKEDKEFINIYLNKHELKLFNNLGKNEQVHSIRTAKDVKDLIEDKRDEYKLIRAALLHDIGKIEKSLNVIDKSVLVMLHKFTKGKLKKFIGIKKIDVYYNHAEKGYNILKQYLDDERVLYLVRNHHNEDIVNDEELEILKKCDSKN
jgi:putative nucleotidyltransferase with HDIG domain